METRNRSITKTEKSVRQYINQLHDQNSKLLVLRVDLGYSKAKPGTRQNTQRITA